MNWAEIQTRKIQEMKLHCIVCACPKMLKLLHSSKEGKIVVHVSSKVIRSSTFEKYLKKVFISFFTGMTAYN